MKTDSFNHSEVVYAFIDSQNLNLGIQSHGWKLDFRKFRVYLRDKYRVQKAFLFIGYIKKYENLYLKLKSYGYNLIFKEVNRYQNGIIKGNVDSELVLYASAKEFNNYEKAIIISGDGDFYCLIEYLKSKNKFSRLLIPNRKGMSKILWEFSESTDYLENSKNKLEK